MANIYDDGTYLQNNPMLHEEDSLYKADYICGLLESINFTGACVKVLDVGGGAGLVSYEVCNFLHNKGFEVECHAFDLSDDMLAIQQKNNPYITRTGKDISDFLGHGVYDLTLLIDVIEHIDRHQDFSQKIDSISEYFVYNIPIEYNFLDFFRNLLMGLNYYKKQTLFLGHLHFFSVNSAKNFVRSHHILCRWIFPDYYGHLLSSSDSSYVKQRARFLRNFELRISNFIYTYMKKLSPWLIHTSIFILASSSSLRVKNEKIDR